MGIKELEKIKSIFKELNLYPEFLEHVPVITSQDAAQTRGFELKQGIKALLFTNGQYFVIVCIPADKKVDQKKVAQFLNWSNSKISLATEQQVEEQTGCQIGSVPPFGHKNQIEILLDSSIYNNQESAFNIGLRTHSVKILTEKMKIVFSHCKAKEGNFIKE